MTGVLRSVRRDEVMEQGDERHRDRDRRYRNQNLREIIRESASIAPGDLLNAEKFGKCDKGPDDVIRRTGEAFARLAGAVAPNGPETEG